jgi:hypothetical protein
MSRYFLQGLIVCTLLIVTGCSNTESENVATAGMSIRMDVEQKNENQVEVSVSLYAGEPGIGATNLRLNGSDTLLATYDGTVRSLTEYPVGFGKYEYRTTFNTTEADKEFKVSLIREDFTDALNNTITLRSDFDVTNPNGDSTFKYDLDFPVLDSTWDPTEITEDIQIEIDAECIEVNTGTTYLVPRSVTTADDGYYEMDLFLDLEAFKNKTFTTCNGELIYLRQNTGSVDTAFGEGGKIYGLRIQTKYFTATH